MNIEAKYIRAEASVRYWEDALVNGVRDVDGDKIPFRNGDKWCPLIRLEDGMVMDWPQGTTARIHYKVCDDGSYYLLDGEKNYVARIENNYVPDDFLCHGDEGYGDYIILDIAEDGHVKWWTSPTATDDEWERLENGVVVK